MRLSFVLFAVPLVSTYSLLRGPTRGDSAPGLPCIAVPRARLIAPGQRTTLHLYDTSSLQVLRHAQSLCNGTYGQVVIDEDAAAARKFRLMATGTRIKILSSAPSTHTDKFGGSSVSVMAEVLGVGIIEPQQVLQHEPFLTVNASDEDTVLQSCEYAASSISEWEKELAEAANLCESLDEVAQPQGLSPSQSFSRGSGGWSLEKCIQGVLDARADLRCNGMGCEVDEMENEVSLLRLSALACTAHLPGEARFDACELAQRGELSVLLQYVGDALKEEGQRRLANKALTGLFGEDGK